MLFSNIFGICVKGISTSLRLFAPLRETKTISRPEQQTFNISTPNGKLSERPSSSQPRASERMWATPWVPIPEDVAPWKGKSPKPHCLFISLLPLQGAIRCVIPPRALFPSVTCPGLGAAAPLGRLFVSLRESKIISCQPFIYIFIPNGKRSERPSSSKPRASERMWATPWVPIPEDVAPWKGKSPKPHCLFISLLPLQGAIRCVIPPRAPFSSVTCLGLGAAAPLGCLFANND